MRIALLGVGLIGGSIGLAAHRSVDGVEVAGYDVDHEILDTACDLGAIDTVAPSAAAALEGADACFACGPVGTLPRLVEEALAAAAGDCVVTDVGSTKRLLAAATDDERFIGGHPIAGSENAGVRAARAELFEGAPWYLVPGRATSGVLYERLYNLLVGFGARPVAIDADTHDRLLATVSHLPHVLANVLVEQAAVSDDAMPRVGPSFRDMTRVAGANSSIWTDIYLANSEAIAESIDSARARLEQVADMLRSRDRDALTRWNDGAGGQRRRLLEADAAAGEIHELRVVVPNRPGIVAELALALGRGGVNIVDMSLAPAADNRSGSIRFWIAGDPSAERARDLLERAGFPVADEQ